MYQRSNAPAADAAAFPVCCFAVRCDADPGALPRLIEVFAKRGLVPGKLFSVMSGQAELTVDLQLFDLDPALMEPIAAQLRNQVGTETVLTSVKTLA